MKDGKLHTAEPRIWSRAGDPPRPAEPGEQLQPPAIRQMAAASGAERDSSSTARRRFLSWSRKAQRPTRGARAASRASPRPRAPMREVRHTQGGPRDHRGVASSVWPRRRQPGGAAGGEPGQVGGLTRGAGASRRGPYVAELVDHDERAGGPGGEQRVELGLPVADRGAGQHLHVAVDQAGPSGTCRRLGRARPRGRMVAPAVTYSR